MLIKDFKILNTTKVSLDPETLGLVKRITIEVTTEHDGHGEIQEEFIQSGREMLKQLRKEKPREGMY